MKTIYIFGSVNIDLVTVTNVIPKQGETVLGNSFFMANGGKGANQAVAASRFGANVKLLGAIGKDNFGDYYVDQLKKEKIDLSFLKVLDDAETGVASIILKDNDNRIILTQGANVCFTKRDIDNFLENAKHGDIFLTQLENNFDATTYALEKAREKGMFVMLNPAPANKEIKPFLKYCDLITPNEGECELLGGINELSKLVPYVIVTLGGEGYSISYNGKTKKYPCIKIKPVDTTGAGDTFCGVFAANLAENKSIEESARLGSLAASISCTKKGAQPSIPYKDEIFSFKISD